MAHLYYRNAIDIDSEGTFIDRHSLWKKVGDHLVLVDDDRYVEHEITEDFYEYKGA